MNFKADITNCDKEPIHIPGKVQSHGVLLAFSKASGTITHVSENATGLFHTPKDGLVGSDFTTFFNSIKKDLEKTDGTLEGYNDYLQAKDNILPVIVTSNNGDDYYCILNDAGDFILAEFEPVIEANEISAEKILSELLTSILATNNLNSLLQSASEKVQAITGYDRVMIYKFLEDDHGVVVAEKVVPGHGSFMGLHFPASDIPKQARELYKKNLVRIIKDSHSTDAAIEVQNEELKNIPLDLTNSVLRAVSPMHIQYLKNMGVRSSFSVSILANGKLWGLIACHNYKESKLIDYRNRSNCKIIGQLLSTSVAFKEEDDNKEQKNIFSENLNKIITAARKHADLPEGLLHEKVNLLSITESTGVALLYEDKVYTKGITPSEEQIFALAKFVKTYSNNFVFQTDNLASIFAEAADYKDIASGLLVSVISKELNEYIFWFKKEVKQSVNWAGNPDKPMEVTTDGTATLSPRASFEIWTQEIDGRSNPWNKNEMAIAMKLREEIVHIITERANQIRKLNDQLKLAYDELDTFSFTISHDLKMPLSTIKNYAELLLEEDNPETTANVLKKILKGVDRMDLLIKEVLGYSRIGREEIQHSPVNVADILEQIKTSLAVSYKDSNASITIKNAPAISGDEVMIEQVFANLLGNALKYSSKNTAPTIIIDAVINDEHITYSIADNGIGIDMKNGDEIFNLFKRMNNATSFEGTGVGLAIVKRILEKHKAIIWYESEPGQGTVFFIKFKTQHL